MWKNFFCKKCVGKLSRNCQPLKAELHKKNNNIINNIKFIEGLSDSFEDENLFPPDQNYLIILDDVIFQASDHTEVVRIFTIQASQEHECHDVDAKCISQG